MKRWSTERAASAVDPRNLAQGINCEAAADDALERDSSGQSSLIVVQADHVCIVGTESYIRRCPALAALSSPASFRARQDSKTRLVFSTFNASVMSAGTHTYIIFCATSLEVVYVGIFKDWMR